MEREHVILNEVKDLGPAMQVVLSATARFFGFASE
jgi:hypothetical protein